ncbi:drug efflux protein-related, partial [Schistosoma mansoni]
TIIIDSHDID